MKLERIHKCLVLSLFLLTSCLYGMAQGEGAHPVAAPLEPKDYQLEDSSVVSLEYNRLVFPAGRQYFDTLYQHLGSLRRDDYARLRILHIGGSHVQADVFSERMRTNMQAFSPLHPVGRGMTFPFSVMGTNGPKDYTYSATGTWTKTRNLEQSPDQYLGLSGAAITTTDITSTLSFHHSQPFDNVLLYGSSVSDTERVYPVLVAEGDTIYPPHTSDEYCYEFVFSDPVRDCTLVLKGDSCGGFTFRGMIVDPYADGLIYTSSGINGAAVPSWLRCVEFENELQALAPDLVLFAIGINDANVQAFSPEDFKQNYRELVSRIRRCNPHCAFIFITNNDCYLRVGKKKKTFNKNTEKVEQAFLELAGEYHGAVWDLYQIMGGYGSSSKWVKAGLMQSDHIHFTVKGYQLLGDMLYNAILQDYQGDEQ